MNSVFLLGRLGKDAESAHTQTGTMVINFSLCTEERRGDAKEIQWHSVKAFGRTAEVSFPLLKKGAEVVVQGKIWAREWKDKNDQQRKAIEIIANVIRVCQPRAPKPHETTADQAGTDEHENNWGIGS